MRPILCAAIALMAVAVAGCGEGDGDGPKPRVADGWVETNLPNRDHTPAFVTIRSAVDDRLVDANVPDDVAAHTLLFETHGHFGHGAPNAYGLDLPKGNLSRMFPRDTATERFDPPGELTEGRLIPAPAEGGPVASQVDTVIVEKDRLVQMHESGYFLMLARLSRPIKAGETIPISLDFEKAGRVEVEVPARNFRDTKPGSLDPPSETPERVEAAREEIESGIDTIRWTSSPRDEKQGVLTGVATDEAGTSVRFGFQVNLRDSKGLTRDFRARAPELGGGGYMGVGLYYFDGPESGPEGHRAFKIENRTMDAACVALTGRDCSFP